MATGLKALPFSFVAHVLALAAAVMVLVWSIHFRGGLAWEADNKNLIFNIHPVLMLIGFVILGGEAIMSYKSFPLEKQVKKIIHLVLHAIALALGIIGIYTAFKNHNESNIPNMYSLHSWIGIGVISLYGIQWVYGFVVFFYPGGSAEIRRDSLPWHVLFGMFVYVMAVGNACLGFLEKLTFLEVSGLAKYGSEAFLVNFIAIATVLYGVFVFLTILSQAPSTHEDDQSYSAIS
ncbi:transmembrane ascorbate ferrireductase 1 [Lycium ferocissimum]|uniref:transmembrane ascorbate ferrireductase 1 n=1 Tax=Lycium ferocissimum TaxID=112874 RepID=UPI0028162A48|nr:transmembrane ascorbate ferrireductase 1 [Lycium ferocissimum]